MDALNATFEPGVFDHILSFLDDSSDAAVCGPGANDIANITDLDGFFVGSFTRMGNVGLQSYGIVYR